MTNVVGVLADRDPLADGDLRRETGIFEFEHRTMVIGGDASARLLELGLATAEGIELIVHAMPARQKFLEVR